LGLAQGAERLADALATYALQERTAVADGLERDILAVIDSSPNEDRFELYRTYNQLMGTWVQVDLSQTLVAQAVAATSPSEEEKIRTTLRDQAQFALWDLDETLRTSDGTVPSRTGGNTCESMKVSVRCSPKRRPSSAACSQISVIIYSVPPSPKQSARRSTANAVRFCVRNGSI